MGGVNLRPVLIWLLVVEVAGLLLLVLSPSPAVPSGAAARLSTALARTGLPPLVYDQRVVEYALNLLLFAPLGLLLALLWARVGIEVWVVIGFCVSGSLETLQWLVLPDRTFAVADLSANTIGTFVGVALALPLAALGASRTG